MPTTPIALTAVVAVLALAGCTPSRGAGGGPPIAQVAVEQLPQEPAHHDPTPLPLEVLPQPTDASDPSAVAAHAVVDGLRQQALTVVDLGAHTTHRSPTAAIVRIAATHTPDDADDAAGGGQTHTSVYELHLTRDPSHGGWTLTRFEQVQ